MKKLSLVLFILLFIPVPVFAVLMDKILATVNGEPVTLSELEHFLQPVYKQYERVYTGTELDAYKKRAREQMLEQLIENKLILQKAKKEGLQITEASMEEEFADVKDKFGSMDEFKAALEKEGMTIEQYKKDLTEQLTIKAMIERELVPKAKVRPEEVKEYYKEHVDEFKRSAMVHMGHILIKSDEKDGEKKIQDAYKQLTEGKPFDEVAAQYSSADDPGFIPVNQLKPELKSIVEVLKTGEYSKIIKTDIGWHILSIKEFKEPETVSLTDTWASLENKLFMKKLAEEHKKWISQLRLKAHVVIEEEI
jgi:peptidyl-prolyl cis-trans isomerase SurA